jgi:predicted small metal-binding protein
VNWLGYKFKCSDIGLQCPFEASADTAEALVKQVTTHGMQAHRAEALTLASKVQAAIKKT